MFGPSAKLQAFLLKHLGPSTQRRYATGLAAFEEWCALLQVPWRTLSEENLDYVLADYVLDGRDQGHPLQPYAEAVASVTKLYAHRRKFIAALKTLDCWRKERPVSQAPPMPEDIAFASVVLLYVGGNVGAALAVLLCFCGLLRINEALALRRNDLVSLTLADGTAALALLLRKSKRGVPDTERVILTHPRVIAFLRAHFARASVAYNAPVCDVSYRELQSLLAKISLFFGYRLQPFRSHSLRRGGATALSLHGSPLSEVMMLGRWASERSCRLYISKAEVLLARQANRLSPKVAHAIATLASVGEGIFFFLEVPTG